MAIERNPVDHWDEQKARIAAFARDPEARFDSGGWDTDARAIKQEISDLRDQLRGAVDTLRHILESAEHPSLTVRSTEYIAKVARDELDRLGG